MTMGDFAENLTHTKFKLRLVCESCGQPQGEGYSVKQPKEWVTTMLPAMKVRRRLLQDMLHGCLYARYRCRQKLASCWLLYAQQ
jgi:hypothetical protein